jgi:competence protein ComEA
MKRNPLDSLLTPNEQKMLIFLSVCSIIGMVMYYTGFSGIYANKRESGSAALEKAVAQDSVVQIDIRTAGLQELMLLPGIGEKRAADIIAYRQNKQFESAEELLNVKGIGAKTYLNLKSMLLSFGKPGQGVTSRDKLADLHTAEAASHDTDDPEGKQALDGTYSVTEKETTGEKPAPDAVVKLNTAGLDELMSLTGIGEVKARAILDYRKQIGRFTSVEQLLDVKGIGPKTLEKNRHRLSL